MARSFFILIFGTFLIAALFTPFAMSIIAWIHPETRWPFSRVYGRIAQLTTVVLIYVLRKDFNLPELKKHFIGNWSGKIGHLVCGLSLTSLSIAVVIPLLVSSGVLVYSGPTGSEFTRIVIEVLIAMLFVSILEETFFRVLVFSSLKSKLSVFLAAILTSFLYAFVHFIAPVRSFKSPGFNPLAGFNYLAEVLTRFTAPDVYPAIFGLFLVGMILCYVMHRTGSLFLCIGLHMGWATGLKIIKFVTGFPGGIEISNDLGGRYFLVAQPQAWLSMLLVLLVLALFIETRKKAV